MILLDSNKKPIMPVNQWKSLIWHERFYDVASFEFHYSEFVSDAKFFYNSDNQQLGIIEDYNIQKTETIYTGHAIKNILNDYIINYTITYISKTPEYIAKDLVSKFCNQDGILIETNQNRGTVIDSLQITGDNLLTYIDTLLQTYSLGCDVVYNYENGTLTFVVVDSVDNTVNKSPYSQNYGDIDTFKYAYTGSSYKNYAYVLGEVKTDGSRERVIVDIRSSTSDRRYELYVDARDLQSTYNDSDGNKVTLTTVQYRQTLYARGISKLQNYKKNVTVDLTSQEPFTLGELRQFKTNNFIVAQQITEIITAWEENTIQQTATFGVRVALIV